MKKSLVPIIAVCLILVAGVFLVSRNNGSAANSSDTLAAVTLHKSPFCGCCGVYGSYLKGLDYAVTVNDMEDMAEIKERFSIPHELESCHTMEVAGYIIEGHIPEAAIQKLLAEKPDIKGIGMAGMPAGSPGMPGPKTGEFVIYEITHEGARGAVFMRI